VSLQLETHSPGSSRRLFATALGVFIANYGLSIPSNTPALAGKPPFSPAGNLPENGKREYNYARIARPESEVFRPCGLAIHLAVWVPMAPKIINPHQSESLR
jgi:hypothetical protein